MAGSKLKKKFIKKKGLKRGNHYGSTMAALLKQGNMLERTGHFGQAEHCFRHAIKKAPGSFQVITRLADFLRDRMRFTEAVDLYQKALGINPNNPEVRHNLGVSYLFLSEFEKARDHLLQTLKLQPGHWLALCNLGKSLMHLGNPDASLNAFQQSIKLKPDFAEAHFELSGLFLVMGRKTEWEASCRRALEINPNLTSAHLSLAKGIKHSGYSADIRAMENLLASTSGTSPMQKQDLYFALGKVYEDLERYDEAFKFITKGNQLHRKTFNYDIQEDVARFDMIRKNLSSSVFNDCNSKGFDGEGVVFILGMPRSGTSLVEQILASHPRVFGAGELDILDDIVRPAYKDAFFDDPKKPLAEMGRRYLSRLCDLPGSAGADFTTDKMPHNFVHIGMIRLILPHAKVIHCCRHPMDTCLSIYKNMFGGGHLYAYELTELGRYYRLYLQLMQHWHKLIPGFVYDLSYEGLVQESEKEIKALLDFCGLEWSKKCLDFHKTKRMVKTISLNQVRKPIYKDSLQLWQKYGDNLKPLRRLLEEEY